MSLLQKDLASQTARLRKRGSELLWLGLVYSHTCTFIHNIIKVASDSAHTVVIPGGEYARLDQATWIYTIPYDTIP